MDIGVTLDGEEVAVATPAVARPVERTGPVSPKTNPNHTPPRSIRVPDELWHAAMNVASDRGESISEAVNRFLARYVKAGMNKDEDPLARQLRRLGA